jgi:hypothetical protein
VCVSRDVKTISQNSLLSDCMKFTSERERQRKLKPSLRLDCSYMPRFFVFYDTASITKLFSFELDDDYTSCNGKFDEKEVVAYFRLCIEQQFQNFIAPRNTYGNIKTRKHSDYNTHFPKNVFLTFLF